MLANWREMSVLVGRGVARTALVVPGRSVCHGLCAIEWQHAELRHPPYGRQPGAASFQRRMQAKERAPSARLGALGEHSRCAPLLAREHKGDIAMPKQADFGIAQQ